jgi:hypothetical protein
MYPEFLHESKPKGNFKNIFLMSRRKNTGISEKEVEITR